MCRLCVYAIVPARKSTTTRLNPLYLLWFRLCKHMCGILCVCVCAYGRHGWVRDRTEWREGQISTVHLLPCAHHPQLGLQLWTQGTHSTECPAPHPVHSECRPGHARTHDLYEGCRVQLARQPAGHDCPPALLLLLRVVRRGVLLQGGVCGWGSRSSAGWVVRMGAHQHAPVVGG